MMYYLIVFIFIILYIAIVESYVSYYPSLIRINRKVLCVKSVLKEELPIKPSAGINGNKLNELKDALGKYGYSGTTAYGIMNLAYYSIATIAAWRISDLGNTVLATNTELKLNAFQIYRQIGKQLLKLSGVVWAGSQVTKIFRLYAAIAMSPFIENAYSKAQVKLGIKSRKKLFWLTFGAIWVVALTMYGTLISISTVQVLANLYV